MNSAQDWSWTRWIKKPSNGEYCRFAPKKFKVFARNNGTKHCQMYNIIIIIIIIIIRPWVQFQCGTVGFDGFPLQFVRSHATFRFELISCQPLKCWIEPVRVNLAKTGRTYDISLKMLFDNVRLSYCLADFWQRASNKAELCFRNCEDRTISFWDRA